MDKSFLLLFLIALLALQPSSFASAKPAGILKYFSYLGLNCNSDRATATLSQHGPVPRPDTAPPKPDVYKTATRLATPPSTVDPAVVAPPKPVVDKTAKLPALPIDPAVVAPPKPNVDKTATLPATCPSLSPQTINLPEPVVCETAFRIVQDQLANPYTYARFIEILHVLKNCRNELAELFPNYGTFSLTDPLGKDIGKSIFAQYKLERKLEINELDPTFKVLRDTLRIFDYDNTFILKWDTQPLEPLDRYWEIRLKRPSTSDNILDSIDAVLKNLFENQSDGENKVEIVFDTTVMIKNFADIVSILYANVHPSYGRLFGIKLHASVLAYHVRVDGEVKRIVRNLVTVTEKTMNWIYDHYLATRQDQMENEDELQPHGADQDKQVEREEEIQHDLKDISVANGADEAKQVEIEEGKEGIQHDTKFGSLAHGEDEAKQVEEREEGKIFDLPNGSYGNGDLNTRRSFRPSRRPSRKNIQRIVSRR